MNSRESPKIIFEEDQWQSPTRHSLPQTPKVIRWVMRYSGGRVKDRKKAEYILVGFVVIAFIVSLFLFFGGGNTADDLENMEILPALIP